MKCAQACGLRGAIEIDRLVRTGVDPERGLDRAAAVACRRSVRLARLARDHLGEASREEEAELVETEIAAAFGTRLRQFAEHDQLGQRRHAPCLPRGVVAERLGKLARDLE